MKEIQAKSPFNVKEWERLLSGHPDSEFVNRVIQYCKQGVHIGYEGLNHSVISPNWPSALENPNVIEKYLADEIAKGRKAGPFDQPPFLNFVGSPMGAIEKKHSNPKKFRIIQDLSWPPGRSVNDAIV